MSKQTVYVETSIVSYLTARPSSDLIVAAHQKATQDWWLERRHQFELRVSEFVLGEASNGNPEAAEKRLAALVGIQQLELLPIVETLASALLANGAVPPKARLDAFHIATASVHRADYLLTWNFRHIANAELWPSIRAVCESMDIRMPNICSPLELLENR
ncbi:type II toxin-antitoxin system VapC family toxin [Methylomagnum sp.]